MSLRSRNYTVAGGSEALPRALISRRPSTSVQIFDT